MAQLSGNELFAQTVKETPLEASALLDLLCENIYYFGDSYYDPLTGPISQRLEEYYKSLGRTWPGQEKF